MILEHSAEGACTVWRQIKASVLSNLDTAMCLPAPVHFRHGNDRVSCHCEP